VFPYSLHKQASQLYSLAATAINAEMDITFLANQRFILARLIANSGNQRDQLREVPAVEP
jgi:hypothetical protein